VNRVILLLFLCMFSLSAQALEGYVEALLGSVDVEGVETGTYTSTETGTMSGALKYGSTLGLGLEVGLRNFEEHNVLRASLSWHFAGAELDSASITTNGGSELASGSYVVSSAELKSVGLNFDNDIHVVLANLYYELPIGMDLFPYVGLGLGVADVENADGTSAAGAVSLGLRIERPDETYWALRYQRFAIGSITDKLGITYGDIGFDIITVTVGMNFSL